MAEPGAPRHDTPTAAPPPHWLPDFCSMPVLLALLLVAELVLLITLFAPDDAEPLRWERLTLGTLYVHWLALLCVLALCRLRPALERMAVLPAVAIAYGTVLSIIALASAAVYLIDHSLNLGATLSTGHFWRFVGGTTSVGGLVAAAAFRYFWVAAQWQRGVQGEARAQVVALQARIRPHFLFNSMNTILSLIRTRPGDAERAVEDLSDLFRAALNAGDGLSTIGEELELVQRYLDIEKLRVGDKLQVLCDVAEAPPDWPVPQLLLQPLVENAVMHGVQALAAGGTIEIRARRDGECLVIAIRNPRPDPPVERPGNRMALDNVRQRMHYHYGERARLELEPGQGYYAVTLTLPRG